MRFPRKIWRALVVAGLVSIMLWMTASHAVAQSVPSGVSAGVSPRYPDVSVPARVDAAPADVAVIVAIENYLLLPPVRGASTTARDWEAFFRTGMSLRDVRVLSDSDATREDILKFAAQAARDVPDGGRLWFVFVGHGAVSAARGDGLLLGVDAQQKVDSLGARGIARQQLLRTLKGRGRHRAVVILDACFSGRASDGAALVEAQPVVAVDSLAVEKGTVVLTAARSDQYAGPLPGSDRPAFSYLALAALRGWGDLDRDGRVTAEELHLYVGRHLRLIPGRTQTPELRGRGTLVTGVRERDPGVALAFGGAPPNRAATPRYPECDVEVVDGRIVADCDAPFVVREVDGPTGVLAVKVPPRQSLYVSAWVCHPRGYLLHIGDSPSNDGGGGDAGHKSNDAEVALKDRTLEVSRNDYVDPNYPRTQVYRQLTAGACQEVKMVVSDNRLEVATQRGTKRFSGNLLRLSPQRDAEGAPDDWWYIGVNRVVGGRRRVGAGLQRVNLRVGLPPRS